MEYELSQKARRLRKSVMEEYTAKGDPDLIPFTSGQPATDMLPLDLLGPIMAGLFKNEKSLFSYPPVRGDATALTAIAGWMVSRELAPADLDESRVIMTNGALGGANLITEMLVDPGTVVMTESPTYVETIDTFLKEGARVVGVPMDRDGPLPEAMEEIVKRDRPKIFYSIPDFQNPTGRCTSLARRRAILNLADKYGFILIEDDPYRELWFDRQPPATFFSMNQERVIYMGSFSKIAAPGLRVGWLVLPKKLMGAAVGLTLTLMMSLPAYAHRALALLMATPAFEEHLKLLRSSLKARKTLLTHLLAESIPATEMNWEDPAGGMFLWCHLPNLKGSDFALKAMKEYHVGTMPGYCFTPNCDGEFESLRLTFSRQTQVQMQEGVVRLAQAMKAIRQK